MAKILDQDALWNPSLIDKAFVYTCIYLYMSYIHTYINVYCINVMGSSLASSIKHWESQFGIHSLCSSTLHES
jgi:hypothetical protein